MKKLFLILTFAVSSFAQTPTPTSDALTLEKQRADRLQERLNDYAQLARYREANTQVKPPAKGENRVVFFGDSITNGWKLDEYFPNQPYINRGIGGQNTQQMLIRMRPDVINLKPKVVVILAGTNDISQNPTTAGLELIKQNLTSIVELAHLNKIKVVLASVLPISDYNKNANGEPIIRTKQRPPELILSLNKWIKDYCVENELIYLDYFSPMVDEKGFLKTDIARDGLHPNAEGYKIMQKSAAEAIPQALKKKQKGVK